MSRELKPRTVGDTIGEVLAVFVAHWATIIGVVGAVTVPLLLVQSVIARNVIDYEALVDDQLVVNQGALRNVLVLYLFTFAAAALASGAVVRTVAGAYIDDVPDIGPAISFAAGHLGVLIVASLLWVVAIVVGLFLFIIPGVIIGVGTVVWAGAALIERHTASGSLRRSWEITSRRKWHVFVVLLVVAILGTVLSSTVSGIATWLGQEPAAPPTLNTIVLAIGANVATSALFSTATAVMYLELRSRKEGAEIVLEDLRNRFQPQPGTAGPDLLR